MGASGAESLNVAASIFMGQTEAPLTIRPFLAGLTESELFTIMISGMAHVSGAVMAAYVGGRARRDPAPADGGDHDRAGHHHAGQDLRSPKSDTPATAGKVEVNVEKTAVNVIDAAAQGAGDGLHLALNIGGHADRVSGADRHGERHARLGARATLPCGSPGRCSRFFGMVFAPVAWLMGVPGRTARPSATCWARAWC